MRGIVEGVNVKCQVPWWRLERCDELIQKQVLQAEEGLGGNGVLKPRERRLTRQILVIDRAFAQDFEDRIAPQHVVIVLVGVVGQDAIDSRPRHLEESMVDVADLTPIVQAKGLGKLLGKSQLFVQMAEGQQPRITGNLAR